MMQHSSDLKENSRTSAMLGMNEARRTCMYISTHSW